MSKKIISAITALIMCAALAGCSDTAKGDESSAAAGKTSSAAESKEETESVSGAESDAEETKESEDDTQESESEIEGEETEPVPGGEADDEENGEKTVYSNEIYSVELDADKWLDINALNEKLGLSGSEESLETMSGSFFYSDDLELDYPTSVSFFKPDYNEGFAQLSSDDAEEALKAVYHTDESDAQISREEHSGREMIVIKTHDEHRGVKYSYDIYVFIENGAMCSLGIYYDANSKGIEEFENNIIDGLRFDWPAAQRS